MPVNFIDNYPKRDLGSKICKRDGTPLYGEIWVYQEFLKFNDNKLLENETWYVKHNYNLSVHPSSNGKVEGQIDFLVLTKYGLLIIEVKGGGIEIDDNDTYYSYSLKNKSDRYEIQNPFVQAKEYVHTLKNLLDTAPFIYRAVIFPHEASFELVGPQLIGYNYLFFSKKDLDKKETEYGKNILFFDFLNKLVKESRKNIIAQLDPSITKAKLEEKAWTKFPLLTRNELERLKSELFPAQNTYGFDPDKIKKELILEENYEILKGLRKNRKVMIQGGPGTGKTVLATKFLAENILKQHRGIFFCANKLLRSKMEYLIYEEYNIDDRSLQFKIYHQNLSKGDIDHSVDFIIIDEAQEFFDKGLYEFLDMLEEHLSFPKVLLLYDPEQSIIQNFKDIDWYADFFMESGFVHYLFDTVWRCAQSIQISNIANRLMNGTYKGLFKGDAVSVTKVNNPVEQLSALKFLVDGIGDNQSKYIILVESTLFEPFNDIAQNYFKSYLEELTDTNVNTHSQKLMYTTPIKFRGLESENVILVTSGFNDSTRIQNFIAVTRAIYNVNIIQWN